MPKRYPLSGGPAIPIAALSLRQFVKRYVIANDLSPSATVAMRRNVELNGLGSGTATDESRPGTEGSGQQGRVRVNEGDAR